MTTKLLVGVTAISALLPVSCERKSDPTLLATVGTHEIRAEQFREQMVRRGGLRPEVLNKEALFQEMIEQEALYVRALNAGIDKDPELQRTWRNLLIGKFKERELAPRIEKAEVTTTELEAAYHGEQERYSRPAAVRVAVLYLKVESVMKPEKVAELQRRMNEARQKALVGESTAAPGFGALAITCSEDQATRYCGGVLGWIEKNRGHAWLGTSALNAAFALSRLGEISEVVADSKGIYLIKLLDRREPALVPLAEVESSLKQRLLLEKRRQIEQAFARECRESVPVVTHPELLPAVMVPTPAAVADNKQPPSFP